MITELLIAILWLIIGVWICWKSDWYDDYSDDDISGVLPQIICILAIICMPLNLIITIIRHYICTKWKNY